MSDDNDSNNIKSLEQIGQEGEWARELLRLNEHDPYKAKAVRITLRYGETESHSGPKQWSFDCNGGDMLDTAQSLVAEIMFNRKSELHRKLNKTGD